MRKNIIKTDLNMYIKLQDDTYHSKLYNAYIDFNFLNINTKMNYYSYQINWDNSSFKDISYEEMLSFIRLLNAEYYKDIEIIYNELSGKSKIITFPHHLN